MVQDRSAVKTSSIASTDYGKTIGMEPSLNQSVEKLSIQLAEIVAMKDSLDGVAAMIREVLVRICGGGAVGESVKSAAVTVFVFLSKCRCIGIPNMIPNCQACGAEQAMRRKYLQHSMVAGFLFLVSCATPYQSHGLLGGFEETQLASDAYRISFDANGYTGKGRAYDFALLRCAQLGESRGFRYFTLKDSDAQNPITGQFSSGSWWESSTSLVRKPQVFLTAKFYRYGKKPETDDIVYDCALVVLSVKKKYDIKFMPIE
ncbi:MAG: hypothetical protein O3C21_16990 [Verrucomicrobia bacterium]|nr:hypothetical protein [Verrucomicrobiota bacterium]